MNASDACDFDFGLGETLDAVRVEVRRFARAEIAPLADGIDRSKCGDGADDVEILGDGRRSNQAEEIGDQPQIVGWFIVQASAPSSCSGACG